MYSSIRPGQVWLDTNGNRIQAHGGSVLYIDGVFYWYGENKEKTTLGSGIWHWGVRCYSSTDMYNWKDEGIIIEPRPDEPDSLLHPSNSLMDRPHIIYNRDTGKYVCWIKCMQHSGAQVEGVLTADHILGPYTMVQHRLKPLGMNAGDFDLVVAPDGKAYYYFERVHTELICADLTDDYTHVTGYYSTHFPLKRPPFVREAPAYFFRDGYHYLFTSGTTAYFPNPSEVAMADTYHGPWTVLGNPHTDDRSNTSYNSQITSVFKHPLKEDLYIALADRWIPDFPERFGERFASGQLQRDVEAHSINPCGAPPVDAMPTTSKADYVWLPVRFDGKRPYIDWLDEWKIEDYK